MKYKETWEEKNSREKFGGFRDMVLERDNFSCVKCGMNQDEHIERFGINITIDHIDRNSKNSVPENLQTLCLNCHRKKDEKRLSYRRYKE